MDALDIQPERTGLDLRCFRGLMDAALAAWSEFEVLDGIGHIEVRRSMPASSMARSIICPAGPTNGRPIVSS